MSFLKQIRSPSTWYRTLRSPEWLRIADPEIGSDELATGRWTRVLDQASFPRTAVEHGHIIGAHGCWHSFPSASAPRVGRGLAALLCLVVEGQKMEQGDYCWPQPAPPILKASLSRDAFSC